MTTNSKTSLSPIDKLILLGLVIAAIGVSIQILSGAAYPKVPPVFFILLIPPAILLFGRWRWISIITAIASLFLLLGLFTSGAYIRLLNTANPGDFAGLWIQTIGDVLAAVSSLISITRQCIFHNAINKTSI